MLKKRSRVGAGLLTVALTLPLQVSAHNESTHQQMTDFAYHVLLAARAFKTGGDISGRLETRMSQLAASDPAFDALYSAAEAAVPKLRSFQSGLQPTSVDCLAPNLDTLFGGGPPDWNLPSGTSLPELPMGQVRLPVSVHYNYTSIDCGILATYEPSGVLASVNLGSFTTRDHTGVTLGYWAAAPDKATEDWVLRSTTLETLQNPVVVGGIGVGVSVAVSAACAIGCGLFPILCPLCPALAVGAGGVVIDEITSIDASALESDAFVGFGHFIDMKSTPGSFVFFDEKPAKWMERAGPSGVPDLTEEAVILLFDLGGIHVNHDLSCAPKNYEILQGGSGAIGPDQHRNSTDRSQSAWETPTLPHIQLTAVDNLAKWGYEESKANQATPLEALRLGWPLHALGDAVVPMHAVGASGYGHRPYEDAVAASFDELVGADSVLGSVNSVVTVLQRALVWRKLIQDWRTQNGSTEVPVRDLVTEVARRTRQRSNANPFLYQPQLSLGYILDEDAATAAYDATAFRPLQKELLLEGIAAKVAFLVSITELEVAP